WFAKPARPWAVIVTGVALVLSAAMLARFAVAADRAGGSVNSLRGLVFTSPNTPVDAPETYASPDGRPLSVVIYRPARSGPAPIIVYAHGGGWVGGSAADSAHELRWFADHGWLVVSADYRLATQSHPTWDEAPSDIACALVWTVAN